MRRAVIITAIISIVSCVAGIVLYTTGTTVVYLGTAVEQFDEDAMDDLADYHAVSVFYTIGFAVSLCFYIFQIVAALKYSVCMLCTAVFFQLATMGFNIWTGWENTNFMIEQGAASWIQHIGQVIFTVTFTGFWLWPVVVLIKEIKSGIMSAETYPREAHSCCCIKESK